MVRRSAIAAIMLLGLAIGARAGEVSPAELPGLVRDLSADEFLTRENAMLRLVAAGPAAIPALKGVFVGGSNEAMSRGLHVLQQLGLSADPEAQEAARAALAEVAARREQPVAARRAAAALDGLIALRSIQALAELEALGAKVGRTQFFNGFATEELIETIEIGPDFKGEQADLRRLKWLAISRLVLAGQRITDDWLTQAIEMPDLEELHLYDVAITDAGVGKLAGHAGLAQVGLYYSPFTATALAPLAKLPALNFVKLYGTKITRGQVDEFQTQTGLAKVDFRRGAFLGVGCTPIEQGCMISTVHRGSPAEKAGLMAEDIFVRFGDSKVADFESLTGLISLRNVGETVEIEVERRYEDEQGNFRTKRIVFKPELTPWEIDLAVRNGPRP
ncbi:MAG: PDZ domain-containing protein [Pirellulaceae bacterium]|nr:PDZ domain-containing protein [Pirellulaceae bacterium]